MKNFTFCNPCEIVFGKDTETQIGRLIKKHGGHKVMLHYGGGSIKKGGLYDRVIAVLRQENIPCIELGGVEPNPRWSLALRGAQMCRDEGVDFILAVGGGSVIDSAKAMAAQVVYEGDVWADFYVGNAEIIRSLPVGTVLTIPAAGSEMSNSSVITHWDTQTKTFAAGPKMTPVFSVMNPELTYTLPPYQVACGAADILAHMMERYFTQEPNVMLTDRLFEGSMRTLLELAPKALTDPTNYGQRAELMWVGTVAHNDFLGCGRVGDWASHDIEHELSALYDIAHGAGLAIVFPAWMKYVCHRGMARFERFATHVMGVNMDGKTRETVVAEGISALEDFFSSMGLATRLSQLELVPDRAAEMARKACLRYGSVGNFQCLQEPDVEAIYQLAK